LRQLLRAVRGPRITMKSLRHDCPETPAAAVV